MATHVSLGRNFLASLARLTPDVYPQPSKHRPGRPWPSLQRNLPMYSLGRRNNPGRISHGVVDLTLRRCSREFQPVALGLGELVAAMIDAF